MKRIERTLRSIDAKLSNASGFVGLFYRNTVQSEAHYYRHSWLTFPLMLQDRSHRKRAERFLEASGIEARPIIAGQLAPPSINSHARVKKRTATVACALD